jgi:hypothetical protein
VDFVDSCATWLADQAAYQQTIADTVAAGLADVEPSDVEDVALATADGTGCASQQRSARDLSSVAVTLVSVPAASRRLAGTNMLLSYAIVVHKTGLTYDALASQLKEAVSSGTMDDNLATYAATYGIIIPPGTGSFSQPDTTNEFSPRPQSKSLSAAMIAMVVVGVVLGLVLIVVAVSYARQPRKEAFSQSEQKAAGPAGPAPLGGSMYTVVPSPASEI